MSHEYILMGNPIPWKRPARASNHFYDAQKHEKMLIKNEIEMQHDGIRKYEGPIKFEIVFYFNPPPLSAKNLEKKLKSPHFVRPDIDNLCKWILDAATGILFKDDCIISSLHAEKKYDITPRTVFTVTEL